MRVGAALCSLICYSDVIRKFWRARLGSNQQPLPSEGSTLSIELRARDSRELAWRRNTQAHSCESAASQTAKYGDSSAVETERIPGFDDNVHRARAAGTGPAAVYAHPQANAPTRANPCDDTRARCAMIRRFLSSSRVPRPTPHRAHPPGKAGKTSAKMRVNARLSAPAHRHRARNLASIIVPV